MEPSGDESESDNDGAEGNAASDVAWLEASSLDPE